MNQNIYYIIGSVAVLFIIYYLIMMKWMKNRTKKQLDSFQKNHSGKQLTNEQKRMLVFGSILTYHRKEEILETAPKESLDQYIYGLKNQWQITNHDSANKTLTDLLELKRSSEFDTFLTTDDKALNKIKKSIAKELKINIQEVNNCKSTYAWDICRLVSLSKWCYWSGHISEDEMWSFISAGANKASQIGKNWSDYTISFLLGRTIQGFDLDDICVEANQLYHSKNALIGKYKDIDVFQKFSFK